MLTALRPALSGTSDKQRTTHNRLRGKCSGHLHDIHIYAR
jgi:hypothetical protein